MPRAFLITHRRYNPVSEHSTCIRDTSPERGVSLAECSAPPPSRNIGTSTGVIVSPRLAEALRSPAKPAEEPRQVIEKPSQPQTKPPPPPLQPRPPQSPTQVPEELYNLTQLAEASVFHPELHGCPECGKRYSTSSNLARHRQTHRSLADKKARRCPHCDKVYVSMPAYSMHVRTHNQGCKCPFCGKCFSRPWLLQGHIRTHTGEKPFRCNICNKAFADKSNLRAHVQTHSNTKPFICGRCGKAFALKSYLYKHEESSCMRLHSSQSGDSGAGSSEEGSAPSSPIPSELPPSPSNRQSGRAPVIHSTSTLGGQLTLTPPPAHQASSPVSNLITLPAPPPLIRHLAPSPQPPVPIREGMGWQYTRL